MIFLKTGVPWSRHKKGRPRLNKDMKNPSFFEISSRLAAGAVGTGYDPSQQRAEVRQVRVQPDQLEAAQLGRDQLSLLRPLVDRGQAHPDALGKLLRRQPFVILILDFVPTHEADCTNTWKNSQEKCDEYH